MTYDFEIHPEAQAEAIAALDHYMLIGIDLYEDLEHRTAAAYGLLCAMPGVGATYLFDTQRYVLDRFPFGIVYRVHGSPKRIQIIAFAHHRRRPGYWRERL